jgi:hypothetical protein
MNFEQFKEMILEKYGLDENKLRPLSSSFLYTHRDIEDGPFKDILRLVWESERESIKNTLDILEQYHNSLSF